MLSLGVNIDHVATLRQARYRGTPDAHNVEPSPLQAALAAEDAGAASITAHLREDRRHMQDRDILELRAKLRTKLNLELGNTPEIVKFAVDLRPEDACLVPENRQEITTEGGLDAAGRETELRPTIDALKGAGVRVSLFIDPEAGQVQAAARLGADVVELHTGAFANALGPERAAEVRRLAQAAELAHRLGLQVNAGHGLSYTNLHDLFPVPHLRELNIGHSIVSRAIFAGFPAAVREMLVVMGKYGLRP
jgi:pyridoxine 5-phosphate synthase